MIEQPQTSATTVTPRPDDGPEPQTDDELVVEDLLVEDVSIDGMCGVY